MQSQSNTTTTAATPTVWSASRDGDLDTVRRLIEADETLLDRKDDDQRTPLHWACASDREAVVRWLLAQSCNAFTTDEGEWTPLMSASSIGNASIVRLLLERMAQQEEEAALELARLGDGAGSVAARARLKRRKVAAGLNARNELGCTALHYACSKLRGAVAAMLLQHEQIEVNVRDNTGATPLHRAVIAAVAATTPDELPDLMVLELLLAHPDLERDPQNKYDDDNGDDSSSLSVVAALTHALALARQTRQHAIACGVRSRWLSRGAAACRGAVDAGRQQRLDPQCRQEAAARAAAG